MGAEAEHATKGEEEKARADRAARRGGERRPEAGGRRTALLTGTAKESQESERERERERAVWGAGAFTLQLSQAL